MLTRNQMWKALCALDENAHLTTTYDGKWFVNMKVEIGGDGFLSSTGEFRDSPDEAITAEFNVLTNFPSDKYIVANAYGETRKHFRWNEFMWKELKIIVFK